MRLFLLVISLLGFSFCSLSQRVSIQGKLSSDSADLEGISIRNLMSGHQAVSQQDGYFSIAVKPGDMIIVAAVHIVGRDIQITQEDMSKTLLVIRIDARVNQLEEVKVDQSSKITSESIGVISGVKSYTPAERRLHTAAGMGGIGPMSSLDPLINWITGRTAMLKKELVVERREMLKDKLGDMFQQEYFTEKLKIPELYLDGFLFYVVEDARLSSAVKARNRTLATFILSELAEKYQQIIERQ
jgi:hypothetical protein